ncbi:excalibur calcium-binding domain-containing protein [Pseudogulbenkiania subflava]|uniref:Excalibur calcium-binding domain-containing protein n=1 Tax=Pseudogulbenkiania subflava DSM 22618 TaxID=1123014 RepID=A0A1Y6B539_9NEIS|nr:excalibur calcium-binding domain-containing protein [Pseudogulbenkiania subflava]SME92709.1 Excalibur calcium-binding domain-containing protein [Pseudogulbenkiania subflava DSM 22618]
MKKLIVLLLIGFLGWKGYGKYQAYTLAANGAVVAEASESRQDGTLWKGPSTTASRFTCDGRTHCSQMTSCEEATFFLKNCPGVKMDGNNDGVPCEQQWCH